MYRHRRLDTNEIFYIGMGYLKRAYSKDAAKRNQIWNRIVNKTEYKVEIVAENLSWEDACELEEFLILLYGRKDLKTGTLANLTNGGDGSKGCSPSKETRKKIGDFHRNKIVSKESKYKMKKAKEGKYFLSNNPNSKKVICLITNEIYDSAKEVANKFNINYGTFTWSLNESKSCKYCYLEDFEKFKNRILYKRKQNSKKVILLNENIIFNSCKEASKYLNINSATLSFHLQKDNNKYNVKYYTE